MKLNKYFYLIKMDYEKKTIKIYSGDRGINFEKMLRKILEKSKLKNDYINQILKNGMPLYSQAFTHPTADENNNYEPLEFLGDSIVNCVIVWYLSRRFPQLNCQDGVKILARLKINLVSKKVFASFGNELGFWKYVSADMETRDTKMKKTLEDVFEAFFGATQKLIDSEIRMGVGYSICYNIIENLFGNMHISLKYEDLYDPKTRLKEVFDFFKDTIGQIKYENERIDRIQHVNVFRLFTDERGKKQKILLGKGSAALKPDAVQKAASRALEKLNKDGIFIKEIPEIYKKLC
jgi:dsRNA-specific ribonuclease